MPELSRRTLFATLAASPAAMELLNSTLSRAADLSASGLVGEIQGPTMIVDPAQWPKTFNEAPMLAELVKTGKLPPLAAVRGLQEPVSGTLPARACSRAQNTSRPNAVPSRTHPQKTRDH